MGEDRLMQARANIITVKEIMNTNPLTISLGKSISDAIRVMRNNHVDSLFVIDDYRHLMGRISLETITHEQSRDASVSAVMDQRTYPVQEDDLVQDTMQRILKGALPNIPVVNSDRQLTGIVPRSALVNFVYDSVWGDDSEEDNSEETVTSQEEGTE
ncbi:CBS domain-containing protein [Aerococcus urinae]